MKGGTRRSAKYVAHKRWQYGCPAPRQNAFAFDVERDTESMVLRWLLQLFEIYTAPKFMSLLYSIGIM